MPTHPQEKKPLDRRILILAAFIVIVIGGGAGALAYVTGYTA
jgi:hypothetical protein